MNADRPDAETLRTSRWSSLRRIGDESTIGAMWLDNPVHDPPPPPDAWPEGRLVAWSGSLAVEDPFSEEIRNWMPAGREALEAWCDRLVGPLATCRRTLAIRPHARQLLSDVAGVVRFLRRHRGERFGMAIAPLDLLTAEMQTEAAEHLGRAFEVLEGLLLPDRDLLIAPASEAESDAARRSLRFCLDAADAWGLEVARVDA